jgi:hypothetical protein
MKYFTPELYARLQDFRSDEAMDAADAAWEKATQRYRRHLRRIWPELPETLRSLLDNVYLHDADVLSMGEQGETFLIVLRLDVPPNELLILKYTLAERAVIRTAAFSTANHAGPMQWMYDEVGLLRGKKAGCTHSILFSNGWEVELRLRGLEVVRAQTVYPLPVTAEALPESA